MGVTSSSHPPHGKAKPHWRRWQVVEEDHAAGEDYEPPFYSSKRDSGVAINPLAGQDTKTFYG